MRLWERLPFFYGWVIVGVAFVCFAVAYGTWHSFSIFFVAIIEEFGWSRAETALTFSVFTLVYGLSAPISGSLIDRFGPRVVFPIGACIVAIGLVLTTRLSTAWEYYVAFGVVVALGLSGMGTVATLTVVNNWFAKKRGVASGLSTAGIGIGMLVLVPLLQGIILGHGWRTAYLVLAIGTLLVIPVLAWTFFRLRPQEVGLLPDGENPGRHRPQTLAQQARADTLVVDKTWASREWTLGASLRTRRFWYVFFGRLLELGSLQMFLVHQVAFFVDTGYDKLLAASVVGLVGVIGSAGKIMWGFVSDRIGRETSFVMAFVAGTVGVAVLLAIHSGSPAWMLYAYAIPFGLCYAASAVLMPVVSADIFQGRRFGSVLGGLFVGGGTGSAMGAFFGGYVFDLTRSYTWAFGLAIPLMWLSCLLYWLSAPGRVRLVAGKAAGAQRPRLQT